MIVAAGGKPVFLDIKKNSLHVTIEGIRQKVTKNTACLVLTHLHYLNPEIAEIKQFAEKKNFYIIIQRRFNAHS